MIQPNEFSPGNYVCPLKDVNGIKLPVTSAPVIIGGIDKFGNIQVIYYDQPVSYNLNYGDYEGLPLNMAHMKAIEWNNPDWMKSLSRHWRIKHKPDNSVTVVNYEIGRVLRYVHELQNFYFWVKGEPMKIEFK